MAHREGVRHCYPVDPLPLGVSPSPSLPLPPLPPTRVPPAAASLLRRNGLAPASLLRRNGLAPASLLRRNGTASLLRRNGKAFSTPPPPLLVFSTPPPHLLIYTDPLLCHDGTAPPSADRLGLCPSRAKDPLHSATRGSFPAPVVAAARGEEHRLATTVGRLQPPSSSPGGFSQGRPGHPLRPHPENKHVWRDKVACCIGVTRDPEPEAQPQKNKHGWRDKATCYIGATTDPEPEAQPQNNSLLPVSGSFFTAIMRKRQRAKVPR